jgi:hypothetical protein
MGGRGLLIGAAFLIAACVNRTAAQSVNGNALALRSSGAASGANWTLNDNGYVGSYVTLASPGNVTISVQASGQAAAGIAPRMNIAVDGLSAGFDVSAGVNTYQHTFALPARARSPSSTSPRRERRSLIPIPVRWQSPLQTATSRTTVKVMPR